MLAVRSHVSFLAVLILAVGCGGEQVTTLSGAVTYKGKPVTSGLINFRSSDGKATLGGPINSDGTYSFELPPGEYLVRIDAPGKMPPWEEGQPEPKPGPREAPVKYADYPSSGLKVTVSGDAPQQQDFELTD
jgi:hypothetical protein